MIDNLFKPIENAWARCVDMRLSYLIVREISMVTSQKILASLTVLLAIAGVMRAENTYTLIDYPGAVQTTALGLDVHGDVAGWYVDDSGVNHGFVLIDGVFSSVDVPGAKNTLVGGINASHQIVGIYSDQNFATHGFVMDGPVGAVTTIDYPGADDTYAYHVNDRGMNSKGQIVGWYIVGGKEHGFLYTDGDYTKLDPPGTFDGVTLGDINNTGGIVGSADTGLNHHGFHYGHGVFKPVKFPGAESTAAVGLNDRGVVVGYFNSRGGASRCFALVKGHFYTIPFPRSYTTYCTKINDSGQVVGWVLDLQKVTHGFLISPP